MSWTVAITGKGGVGKTTVAALMVARLIAHGRRPVLAVDADPNSCLDQALGVRVQKSIGSVREETRELVGKGALTGISKQEILALRIAESLVEAQDFDLLSMGRPEGPGCYCYANNVLRDAIHEIAAQYPYVVIDNEAGLENLSRRIVASVDLLVIVGDPSARGLATMRRVYDLAREMGTTFARLALVVNRLRRDELPPAAAALQAETGASVLIGIRDDEHLAHLDEQGLRLQELGADSPVVARIDELLRQTGVLS